MRDTIRDIPVGNRARERIGYLMRDAISMAISRQYAVRQTGRRVQVPPHGAPPEPRGYEVVPGIREKRDERDACEVHVPPH